jgi:hypothetical protein
MLKKFSGLDDADGEGDDFPLSVTGSVKAKWYSHIQGGPAYEKYSDQSKTVHQNGRDINAVAC